LLWAIGNSRRATHLRGVWTLGSKRSVLLKEVSFLISMGLPEINAQIEQLERQKETAVLEEGSFEKAAHLRHQANVLRKRKSEASIGEYSTPGLIRISPQARSPFTQRSGPLELYQDSSGGSNWQSSNHANRYGVVPNASCGYRLQTRSILSPPA